ncbi:MAG: hypothetical protein AAF682_22160 [Planctomycetota bacterium]
MTRPCACLAASLLWLFAPPALAQTLPDDIDISASPNGVVPLPGSVSPVFTNVFGRYTKIVAPNGKAIHFLLQDQVTDEMAVRARETMRFYLTDVPGTAFGADKTAVANSMADLDATLVYFNTEQDAFLALIGPLGGSPMFFQDLYAEESVVEGTPPYATNSVRDATLEEVFHLVHGSGILPTLPAYHQEIVAATNAAIAAGFYDPPFGLPPQDNPFEYIISVIDVHYGFWAHNPSGDGTSFGGEYDFHTLEEVEAGDPAGLAAMLAFLPPHFAAHLEVAPTLAADFRMSFEPALEYTLKSQYLCNLRLSGANSNALLGNARDNELGGNAGDNLIDGAAGDDVALFRGPLAEYTVQCDAGGFVVADTVAARDGTDTLLSIERLRFADQEVDADQFCPTASASVRNGSGVNPVCLASTAPPALGCTWTAEVDTSGHPGAVLTFVASFSAAESGVPLAIGELLVDPGSIPAFSSSAAPAGGVALHAMPLPYIASAMGLPLFAQGLIASAELELCKARDVGLGVGDGAD